MILFMAALNNIPKTLLEVADVEGASAFHKLLFPHVHSIDEIEQEDQENFKRLYAHYCLEPAINMRRIIRQQCHLLDKEFKAEMGEFKMRE